MTSLFLGGVNLFGVLLQQLGVMFFDVDHCLYEVFVCLLDRRFFLSELVHCFINLRLVLVNSHILHTQSLFKLKLVHLNLLDHLRVIIKHLVEHYSLVVLGHAPTYGDFLLCRPRFYLTLIPNFKSTILFDGFLPAVITRTNSLTLQLYLFFDLAHFVVEFSLRLQVKTQ